MEVGLEGGALLNGLVPLLVEHNFLPQRPLPGEDIVRGRFCRPKVGWASPDTRLPSTFTLDSRPPGL